MKRRGFLKLLGLLPFAPALAEAAAATIKPAFDPRQVARIANIEMASGADSTSIWLVNWEPQPTLLDVAERYNYKHMLPVIETLNQKNPLLQDVVWQEKNVQLGHRVNWGSRWIGKSRRLM